MRLDPVTLVGRQNAPKLRRITDGRSYHISTILASHLTRFGRRELKLQKVNGQHMNESRVYLPGVERDSRERGSRTKSKKAEFPEFNYGVLGKSGLDPSGALDSVLGLGLL